MLLRLLAAAVLAAAGCGGAPVAPVDRPQADARAAIAGLSSSYENARAEEFFARFDAARFPGFEAFRDAARQRLLRDRQITLSILVDSVESQGAELGARVHWNKSFVNEAGANRLSSGSCELVFRRRSSGELLLANVQGDSPF